MSVIRIGTRGSLLASTQAQGIADRLTALGHPAELVIISTDGDVSTAPVAQIGVGVFTTAIRIALRNGECDVAIHSYKDLPTAPEPDLAMGAVPARVDPQCAGQPGRTGPRGAPAGLHRGHLVAPAGRAA